MKTLIEMLAMVGVCAIITVFVAPAKAEEPVVVVNDFMCGLYRVMIRDDGGLMVNEQPYGEYKTTSLTRDNSYVHQFGEKAELRVSQLGRIAFRLAGETRWASCKPLVFYQEQTQ